jgi:hypothetical protein
MQPKRRGERPKPRGLRLDLQMTAEPQPELIHTRRDSRTGTRKARTSRSQRDLFTSPSRTRKNKGWVSTQAARLQHHWINLKSSKVVDSLHMGGGIYTRNNPPRWVETWKETGLVDHVKGEPRNGLHSWYCETVWLLRDLQCFDNNST